MKPIFSIFALILSSFAYSVAIPDWLPSDLRFDVNGTSNEIRQVESTLATMRDSISPEIRQFLDKNELLGSYLQWLVRWARPGVTNENIYLSWIAQSEVFSVSDFDRDLLTNSANRVQYMPPALNLSLAYNDGVRNFVHPAEPSIDYPGMTKEDDGTSAHDVRLVLRAPKMYRHFRIKAVANPHYGSPIEFRCVVLHGHAHAPWPNRISDKSNDWTCDVFADINALKAQKGESVVAIFAREQGKFWGPPSVIHISADPLCRHEYVNRQIYAIDYGKFKDFYNLDGQNRILGFTRHIKANMIRQDFSNRGEYVVEFHPNDTPKIARPVRYFLDKDGKLDYEVSPTNITYKLAPMQFRPLEHF